MHLDRDGGQLYLRIVFAGAALSGKTQTLQYLIPNLHGRTDRELISSPLEARGRTLYFDWAEYEGGLFHDGRLHCQIVTVPGQESLHGRRGALIEDADVVVFVVDSLRTQLAANQRTLAEMQRWLGRDGLPPVDVIYQCNKLDLPDTLSVDELKRALALDAGAEVHGCSALQGEGIRVCFVAAVRACVRRADLLLEKNRLPMGPPPVQSGAQLLDRLREIEDVASDAAHEIVVEVVPPAPLPVPQIVAATIAPPPSPPFAPPPSPPFAPPPTPTFAPPPSLTFAPPPSPTLVAPAMAVQRTQPAGAQDRPAIMPMSDWIATHPASAIQPRRARPAPTPLAAVALSLVEAEPEPEVTRVAEVVIVAPPPPARPAIIPMSAWIAQQPAPREIVIEAEPASELDESFPAEITARTMTIAPARPAVMPMSAWLASIGPPAPARVDFISDGIAQLAEPGEPPTPWLVAGKWSLVDAWPLETWSAVCEAARPEPSTIGEDGGIGAGWFVRSGAVEPSVETARVEYNRLVDWLTQLGDWVATNRCVVLSRNGSRRWAASQLLHKTPTLAAVVAGAFGAGVSPKRTVTLLAHASAAFLLAVSEFTRREIRLPVHLHTVARHDRHTVYADFLPAAPAPISTLTPMARLEEELRAHISVERRRQVSIPEALRELEHLAHARPQLAATVELLQSLLIGS